MSPKTYSNGTEQVDPGTLRMSGTHVAADLRMEDGFHSFEAGFIDAPWWMSAGSTLKGAIRGDTPATIPTIVIRN